MQRGDCGYSRKYYFEFDPFLSSQTAACRQTLRDRVLQSLERISALSDNVVIGLNLGVCRRLEKMDPGQTVNNLIEIHGQFKEKVQLNLNEACFGCSMTDFDIRLCRASRVS